MSLKESDLLGHRWLELHLNTTVTTVMYALVVNKWGWKLFKYLYQSKFEGYGYPYSLGSCLPAYQWCAVRVLHLYRYIYFIYSQ